MSLWTYGRLIRAGFVLAREGAFSLVDEKAAPARARWLLRLARSIERGEVKKTGRIERLKNALHRLGPTYVKFGQTLATRPDIVGAQAAADLSALQDQMDPFDQNLVPKILEEELGEKAEALEELSDSLAAASIAQVHHAKLADASSDDPGVAVKILRPEIEERFARDLTGMKTAARWAEALVQKSRRLKPVEAIEILERSAQLELDLRFEAAAISEFADNLDEESRFIVPEVKWDLSSQRVLTTNWLDGIPLHDLEALDEAKIDRKKVAADLLEGFLRHAIGSGFFHADMHPGNLFAQRETNKIIMVDFGIMGRINARERRFLAEILYGFITRNYRRMAQLHIDIGYVPADQSVDDFALALRTIGEPLQGRTARDISMAKVLGQLLRVTELFHMQTRPELLLLQKNMVLVEGVARHLDPDLNIWDVSEPFVSDWIRKEAGPIGQIKEIGEELNSAAKALRKIPSLIERAESMVAEQEQMQARYAQRPTVLRWWLFGLIAIGAILGIWALL